MIFTVIHMVSGAPKHSFSHFYKYFAFFVTKRPKCVLIDVYEVFGGSAGSKSEKSALLALFGDFACFLLPGGGKTTMFYTTFKATSAVADIFALLAHFPPF